MFRPCHLKQELLLPPDLRDWWPEDHLAHLVSDLVDGLDLTAFCTANERDGRRNAPYELRMMVKFLIYGYATGVFSSRGMAKKLATAMGRVTYATRRWMSETARDWIKEGLGFRRFTVRGLRKAQAEWNLVCLALNVKWLQSLMMRSMGSLTLRIATPWTPSELLAAVSLLRNRISRRKRGAADDPRPDDRKVLYCTVVRNEDQLPDSSHKFSMVEAPSGHLAGLRM